MNEELKIIISAEIDKLKSELQKGQKEVNKFTKGSGNALGKFTKTMKKVGSAVAAGLKVAIGAISAAMTALVALGASTKQYREEQARLNAAFKAAGSSAAQASKSYNNLFRFLGDSGKASEAAAHLAKLTTSEQSLAEWTTACQGIYATFGESLPIEGLTEAANETARVGTVTGTLADALNWAGINEDAFNESLAKCTSLSERETLIRKTLNGVYGEAAQIYEENNKGIIKQNEANARLQATLGKLGAVVTPLVTSLTEFANVILEAITPAIEALMPIITSFVDKLALGVQYIAAFFGAFSNKGANEVAGGIEAAANGTGALASGFKQATEAAKALKKQTAGFDELNVMQSEQSTSGAAGLSNLGSITIDTSGFNTEMDTVNGKMDALHNKVKDIFDRVRASFEAFKSGILALVPIWDGFVAGLDITEIVGRIVFAFEEGKSKISEFASGLDFSKYIPTLTAFAESAGNYANTITTNVLDIVGTVTSDIFDAVAPIAQTFINDTLPTFIDMLGGFYDICSTVVDELSKLILQAWDTVSPVLTLASKIVVDLQNILNEFWKKHGEPIVSAIQEGIESLGKVLSNYWSKVVNPIFTKLVNVVEKLWKQHLKPVVEKIMDIIGKLVETVMAFWNNVLAPVVNWIINTFAPPIVKVWETILDVVGDVVGGIIDFVGGLLDALGGVLDFLLGVFTGDWKKAWEGIKSFVSGIWDAICSIVKAAVDLVVGIVDVAWTGLKGLFEVVWNAIKSIVTTVWNAIKDTVTTVVDVICNFIRNAWTGIKDFFQTIWNGIKSIFETVMNAISTFLQNAWNGIKNVVETVWNAISSTISTVFNGIKTVISNVMNVIATIISTVLSTIKTLWNGMCTAVSGAMSGLATTLSNIVTNIRNAFTNGFNAVKTSVINIFNNIKTSVSGIMTGLQNCIKTPINAIIGFINGLTSGVAKGINGMIKALNSLSFEVPDWVPGIGGGTFGFDLSTISIPQIPKLATGGIVTESILANIGEAGKEAVLPLEHNTEWMDTLVEKIAARNGAPSKIVLQVGEKELGWAVIDSINQITKQTGGLQLAL